MNTVEILEQITWPAIIINNIYLALSSPKDSKAFLSHSAANTEN